MSSTTNPVTIDKYSPTWVNLVAYLNEERADLIRYLLRPRESVREEDVYRGQVKMIDRVLSLANEEEFDFE